MKKQPAKVKDNRVYCSQCGNNATYINDKGKVEYNPNGFVMNSNGYGINLFDVRSVFSRELNTTLTEMSCTCSKCGTVNTYLVDISRGKRYEELGQIEEVKEDGGEVHEGLE